MTKSVLTLCVIVSASWLTSSAAELSFEQRVEAQEAIERVYWAHRIWPEVNPAPKPAFEEVVTEVSLRAIVDDYLRKSVALEEVWGRRITREQLQTELQRMVSNTNGPAMLKELFEAIGNAPEIIAETLARKSLVDRLVGNAYAQDLRFHGDLRRRAEGQLRSATSLKDLHSQDNLIYFETTWRLVPGGSYEGPAVITLRGDQWNDLVFRLARQLDEPEVSVAAELDDAAIGNRSTTSILAGLQVERPSSLLEERDSFYAVAILDKGEDHLTTATVSWSKQSFDSWWAEQRDAMTAAIVVPDGPYKLDVPESPPCEDDTWRQTHVAPPEGREDLTAIWTGTEMIVWGGVGRSGQLASGGRYNPATDSWTPTSIAGAPRERRAHSAVWTGQEMIVWGGQLGGSFQNTGGRYDPASDTWTATPTENAPSGRAQHSAVWTGKEMIVWSGVAGGTTGGRYNPVTDAWTPTSTDSAPEPRARHTTVWTGQEMIVWGGFGSTVLNTGGRYDPATDTWSPVMAEGSPEARQLHTAVWSGREMVIWGGVGSSIFDTGKRYDPATDMWTSINNDVAPGPRYLHSAVWTGSEMIIWGGTPNGRDRLNTGGRYDPELDSWTPTDLETAPSPRTGHAAVWTGTEMILWGGIERFEQLDTGARYSPERNHWIPTSMGTVPNPRSGHTAVWTGSEMIVWGGVALSLQNAFDTGGRYDPALDVWTPTSTDSAPRGRFLHAAVWTGREMVVWGSGFGTGGRYDAVTDTWRPMSTENAPTPRQRHKHVWTGTELIVWGGVLGSNTGGRYNPTDDSWTPMSLQDAPLGRQAHSMLWTGTEMIVWGGLDARINHANTGGRYDPTTDTWRATPTENAPSGRAQHSAVWTGEEMIVWGGSVFFQTVNTGGRYDPVTDSWTATTLQGAPTRRNVATAVWTGTEMIVWGGNTAGPGQPGGRYNPHTNAWKLTSMFGVPGRRSGHTAVWTGTEMIVWGGGASSRVFNTGGRYCAAETDQPPSVDGALLAVEDHGDDAAEFIVQATATDPEDGTLTPSVELVAVAADGSQSVVATLLVGDKIRLRVDRDEVKVEAAHGDDLIDNEFQVRAEAESFHVNYSATDSGGLTAQDMVTVGLSVTEQIHETEPDVGDAPILVN